LRRARRLDEQIVRTVATSTSGLLAQLRLLSAFYDQSTNGAALRGALLIQTIVAGIERLDAGDLVISPDAMNGVDRISSTGGNVDLRSRREIASRVTQDPRQAALYYPFGGIR
jgi:hypothetical protein